MEKVAVEIVEKVESKENIKKEDKRDSNFEVLRILSMIMIVFHHLAVHSGLNLNAIGIFPNVLWVKFIQMGGKIGVNLFVLISGYFLINSEKIKISKILKLWVQISFTSISVYIIFNNILGTQKIEIQDIIKRIFPIIFEVWWFPSTYFVLYIISPVLNSVLKRMERNSYKKMLLIILLFWCIIPTLVEKSFQSNSLIWFVTLYCIAGYIRLYGKDWKIKNKEYFLSAIAIAIVTYISVILLDLNNIRVSNFEDNALYFYNMQRAPVFLISVFIFLGFKETKVRYSKFINMIASTTFGIYLIHDYSYIRKILWQDFFKIKFFENSKMLIPYSILVCFIIFICCILIELIRIYIIEKQYMKVIYKIEPKINKLMDRIIDSNIIKKI